MYRHHESAVIITHQQNWVGTFFSPSLDLMRHDFLLLAKCWWVLFEYLWPYCCHLPAYDCCCLSMCWLSYVWLNKMIRGDNDQQPKYRWRNATHQAQIWMLDSHMLMSWRITSAAQWQWLAIEDSRKVEGTATNACRWVLLNLNVTWSHHQTTISIPADKCYWNMVSPTWTPFSNLRPTSVWASEIKLHQTNTPNAKELIG